MTKTQKYCDRCGDEIVKDFENKILPAFQGKLMTIRYLDRPYTDSAPDICSKCIGEFTGWWMAIVPAGTATVLEPIPADDGLEDLGDV